MVLSGNLVVDIAILVVSIGVVIYQFVTGKAQEAAHLAEQIAEYLPNGLSGEEKKKLAISVLRAVPFLAAIPEFVLSWLIELVLRKVNESGRLDLAKLATAKLATKKKK